MLYGLEKFPKRRDFHSGFMNGFTGIDLLEDYPGYQPGMRSPYPAVNIAEYDKDYEIELAAPGLCKKDYDISIQSDTLKVKTIRQFEKDPEVNRFSRREFASHEFEKVFVLPENADTHSISASCIDGILKINIPKKIIEARPKSRTINVR